MFRGSEAYTEPKDLCIYTLIEPEALLANGFTAGAAVVSVLEVSIWGVLGREFSIPAVSGPKVESLGISGL
jgi:hypothetical protein